VLTLAICSSPAALCRAQDAKDPEAAQKEINAWYTEQITKARAENKQPDFQALMKERTERAKTATKDFDPEKIEPAKGMALAQLYQMAQDDKKMVASLRRYLTSNPADKQRFDAQNLMLSGYANLEDAEGLAATLKDIKPADGLSAATLAYMTGARYATIVAQKKGAQAGLDLIARTEAAVPFAELLAKPDVPGRDGKPGPPMEKTRAEMAIMQIAQGRAEILEHDGKKDAAVSALRTGKEKLPAGSRFSDSLDSKITLLTLPGSPAPELIQERGYGGFKSLSDYKGKVVVVEFTAHW
jgi:hypothetical protein